MVGGVILLIMMVVIDVRNVVIMIGRIVWWVFWFDVLVVVSLECCVMLFSEKIVVNSIVVGRIWKMCLGRL